MQSSIPKHVRPRSWAARVLGTSVGVALALCLGAGPAQADGARHADAEGPRTASVKAIFVYQFTKYVQWPDDADKAGPFVVGVLGETPVAGVLEEVAARKRVQGRRIVVKRFKDTSALDACHILYVAEASRAELKPVLDAVGTLPTLVVGGAPGMAREGASISFVVIDGKMKFELNRSALERAGLRASSQLLKLARLVRSS